MLNKNDALGLNRASEYRCQVWRYYESHGLMYIRLHLPGVSQQDDRCLVLSTVAYYQGPMHWKGAGVNMGTQAELSEYIRALQLPSILERSHTLYKFISETPAVTVLAHQEYSLTSIGDVLASVV